ncbi:MAG TPA: molybdate ABC transporter substrate-binding protein [Casimicrobiaceae bacterium]
MIANRLCALAALAILIAVLVPSGTRAADVPTIAAASSVQYALTDIAAEFRRETGHAVRLAFGSSGNFRRQIADGAPFELFLSADEGYADALVREGRTLDPGVIYAVGRLVLFVPNGSPIKLDPTLADLGAALSDGRLHKLAIANPALAPYGRAAQQALARAGLWQRAEPHLVQGENISQAGQFAASGAAQAGIIAYSLTREPGIAERGRFALLPASDHAPLAQKMVLLKGAGATARAFEAFVQSPKARAIFAHHGFEAPQTATGSAANRGAPPRG